MFVSIMYEPHFTQNTNVEFLTNRTQIKTVLLVVLVKHIYGEKCSFLGLQSHIVLTFKTINLTLRIQTDGDVTP